uniref:Uncharacterized protein n=1 Tax=Anguilla anguilla TaxID=7936 RepID=A0A0E9PV46_ANGAN
MDCLVEIVFHNYTHIEGYSFFYLNKKNKLKIMINGG